MTAPLVTVGMCVRNGAAHVGEAIESFLTQTFDDFSLVVYDNASTDSTPEILRRYARRDRRIVLVRHDVDIGMAANYLTALERADTEYFCWAACDDLRDASFLAVLVDLLKRHPEAGLACCGAIALAPDGTPLEPMTETKRLCDCVDMRPRDRILMYLKDGPVMPLYGLFRTKAAREQLGLLRRMTDPPGRPPLRADTVLLAAFLKRHGLVLTRRPLMKLRLGGFSDRLDRYDGLTEYLREIRRFAALLNRAVSGAGEPFLARLAIRIAAWGYILRFAVSPPMRPQTMHYLFAAAPPLSAIHARCLVTFAPAFRRLRRHARALPSGSRVMVFGAGKHTRRSIRAIKYALGRSATIVGICDDAAGERADIDGHEVIAPEGLSMLRPDIILISSDWYERALWRRAQAVAPPGARVWCMYDTSLEPAMESRDGDHELAPEAPPHVP